VDSSNINIFAVLIQAEKDSQFLAAAKIGDTTTLVNLISAGADLNAKNNYGNTALILAAENNYTTVVSTLIAAGANIHSANNKGDTALMKAAWYGCTEIVSALINAGANVKTANKNGQTVLKIAAICGHTYTAFRLLSAMSFQDVVAFQNNPVLGDFAKQSIQKIDDIRLNIFYILSTFRATRALSHAQSPITMVLSNIVPEWYRHRLNRDVESLSIQLMRMFKKPVSAAQLALTATTPAISVSALTSAVVPYLPAAAGAVSRREKNPERQNNKTRLQIKSST
jgi:hypothetical protein